MGRFIFFWLFYGCFSVAVATEVIIDPYEDLHHLPEDAIVAFHYETECNPCIEVIEAENDGYEADRDDSEPAPQATPTIPQILFPYLPSYWDFNP